MRGRIVLAALLVASCSGAPRAPRAADCRIVMADLSDAEITYIRPILRAELEVVDRENEARNIVPVRWGGTPAALGENILMIFQEAGVPVRRIEQKGADFVVHTARGGFAKGGAQAGE